MGKLPFEKEKRELIEVRQSETNERFGQYPDKRPVELLLKYGIVNLDKPPGPTSHQASYYLSRIIGVDKAGHSGTLDPKVTGCLPVSLNKATKIANLLLKSGKEYITVMHLHSDIEPERIKNACRKFVGTIEQVPPIKSAVKRVKRKREIYYLEVLEIDGRDVLFRVGCEAGTYIRKLCHDIGASLGTGAHMAQLRRTKSGPFNENTNLVSLQDVSDAWHYYKTQGNERFIRHCIQPMEKAVEFLPKVYVMDSTIDPVCHGTPVNVPGIVKAETGIIKDGIVAVMSLKGELIAYGKAAMSTEEIAKSKRGCAVKTDSVFMSEGTYPKYTKSEE
ncbi:MAG TPA: RNA-guided pseudouridylation complex pseudouridine synthase subunit Cbf5 [Candidatus Woesearchaeota archaeon]|nr:RNA-guided pseudouridylation complex pseudouridine synthase subunit Cbf5 [Candidatus Woesearchaeota archaeon]